MLRGCRRAERHKRPLEPELETRTVEALRVTSITPTDRSNECARASFFKICGGWERTLPVIAA